MAVEQEKIIIVNGEQVVKKAQTIIQSRYTLNPLSLKFITCLVSGIRRSDNINQIYTFKVEHFKELTGLKRKDLYKAVENALKEILSKPLKIEIDENSFLMVNWISSGIYGNGRVKFRIDPELRPYLLEAKEKFVKYKLENILSLKSGYSIRLYEILKDWYNTNSRYGNKSEVIKEITNLKKILVVPKSYNYGGKGGIKDRILEKAKQDLSAHTDIIFDYEEIKTGRKVTHLKFTIQPNPKKLKEQEQKIKPYLKSFKTFTDYLRDKWAGNLKFFFAGIDTKINKEVFFGINNKGLLYSTNGGKIIEYNAIESKEKYIKFYKIFKKSEMWQDLLETQTNLVDVRNNNIDLFKLLILEVKEILS